MLLLQIIYLHGLGQCQVHSNCQLLADDALSKLMTDRFIGKPRYLAFVGGSFLLTFPCRMFLKNPTLQNRAKRDEVLSLEADKKGVIPTAKGSKPRHWAPWRSGVVYGMCLK